MEKYIEVKDAAFIAGPGQTFKRVGFTVMFVFMASLAVTALKKGGANSFSGSNFNSGTHQSVQDDRPEHIFIALMPNGFDQKEMSLKGRRFLFAIDNRSGIADVTFILNRDTGQRLSEKRLSGGKLKWHQLVDITSGKYVLTVANHPEWKCAITVSTPGI